MFKKKSLLVFFLVLFSLQAFASFTIEDNSDVNTNVEFFYDEGTFEFTIVHAQGKETLIPYVVDLGEKLSLKDLGIEINFLEDIEKPTDDKGKEIENQIKWGITFTKIPTTSEIGFDFIGSQNLTRIDSNSSDARIEMGNVTQDFSDIINQGYIVSIVSTGKNSATIKVTGLPAAGVITLDPIIIKTGGAMQDLTEPSKYGLVKDGNFFATAWIDDSSGTGALLFSRSVNGGTTWAADINLSAGLTTGSAARIFDFAIDTNRKTLHLVFTGLNTQVAPNTTNYYYRVCSYNIDVNCSTLAKWSAGFDLNFIVPSNDDTGQTLSPMGIDVNSTGTVFVTIFTQIGVGNREIALIHADGNTQLKANWKSDSNAVFSNAQFNLTTGLDLIVTNDANVNIVGGVRSPSPFVRYSLWNAHSRTFLIQDQNTSDSCRVVGTACSYATIGKKTNGDLVVFDINNGVGEILVYRRATNTWLPAVGVTNTSNRNTMMVYKNNDVYITAQSTNIGYRVYYDSNNTLSGFNQLEAEASNCCRKISNYDSNNSIEIAYVTSTGSVKFTRIGFAGAAISFSIKTIEGIDDFTGTFPTFSQVKDGNLTIGFFVLSDTNANILVDLNFSTFNTDGTGTVIINDLNLNSSGTYCQSQNFALGTLCFWDFNISPQFVVSDGNYYVTGKLSSGITALFNASDKNFLIDNTPPTLVDLNVFITGSTFRAGDTNAGFLIRCNDNNGTILRNTIARNDVNVLDVNAPRNTFQSVDGNVPNGQVSLSGYCFDQGLNSVKGTSITSVFAIQFIIIDEETGQDFNVFKVDSLKAINFVQNTVFDFQLNNTNKVFFVSGSSDKIRFDFNYAGGIIISRDFNVTTLPTTDLNTVKVCGVKSGATFSQQLLISSQPKAAQVISDLYDCYVLSDYTQFTVSETRSVSAYTIATSYSLYSRNDEDIVVQLSLIDGSTAHTINLDILDFGSDLADFSVGGESLSVSYDTDTNAIFVYYLNVNNDNNSVTINIFDGTDSNSILFSTTNNTTPNEFSTTFTAANFTDFNKDFYKIQAVVTKTNSTVKTINSFFSLKGTRGNSLDPALAAIIGISVMIMSITLVASRYAFGWFGIVAGICAIAFTTFAPPIWYLTLIQAMLVIVTVFISIVYWKENSTVT